MPITRAMAARGSSDNIAVKRVIKDEDSEQVKDLEQIATNESYNETPNEPLPNSGNSEVPLTRSDWDADKIINSDPPQVKQAVHDDLEDGEIGLDDDIEPQGDDQVDWFLSALEQRLDQEDTHKPDLGPENTQSIQGSDPVRARVVETSTNTVMSHQGSMIRTSEHSHGYVFQPEPTEALPTRIVSCDSNGPPQALQDVKERAEPNGNPRLTGVVAGSRGATPLKVEDQDSHVMGQIVAGNTDSARLAGTQIDATLLRYYRDIHSQARESSEKGDWEYEQEASKSTETSALSTRLILSLDAPSTRTSADEASENMHLALAALAKENRGLQADIRVLVATNKNLENENRGLQAEIKALATRNKIPEDEKWDLIKHAFQQEVDHRDWQHTQRGQAILRMEAAGDLSVAELSRSSDELPLAENNSNGLKSRGVKRQFSIDSGHDSLSKKQKRKIREKITSLQEQLVPLPQSLRYLQPTKSRSNGYLECAIPLEPSYMASNQGFRYSPKSDLPSYVLARVNSLIAQLDQRGAVGERYAWQSAQALNGACAFCRLISNTACQWTQIDRACNRCTSKHRPCTVVHERNDEQVAVLLPLNAKDRRGFSPTDSSFWIKL